MQQKKKKRNITGIIVAAVCVAAMVVMMIVWQEYESKHKAELKSSMLTSDVTKIVTPEPVGERETSKPEKRLTIPDDPEQILVMANDALADEGYFKPNYLTKGFHVYTLLTKCLECGGDTDKVSEMAKRLKERSDEGYGPWHVEGRNLTSLDEKIAVAKQM